MNTKLDALLDTLDALDHPLPSDLVAFMQSLPPQGTLPSPWMTWTLFGLMRFRCAALKPPQFSLCPMFIRKHSLGFLIALCFASLLNSLALAQRPAVKELSDGVDLRHATYRDLKFVYDVRYKTEISPTPPPAIDTSGDFVSARDVFKLSGGTSVAKPEKWNSSWVRTSSRGLGQQAMTDFYVTDDEIEYSFTRWNSNLIGAIREQHSGKVLPRSYGTSYYENTFKNFLFLRFNNLPILEIICHCTVRFNTGVER